MRDHVTINKVQTIFDKVHGESKRRIVVLTVTENCNLNCDYCFEKQKSHSIMPLHIAKKVIEHEFNDSNDFDEIEFDLFGGEPTLCKEMIIDLVEWTKCQKFSKPFVYFLETNGTLVHGEFKDWLSKNTQYVIAGLSLDGTPETHNINRSNSFHMIDVPFFTKNYPKQSVRMTINNRTIGSLANDIIYLHDLGFLYIVATFAHGVSWELDDFENIIQEQLLILCNYYIDNPTLIECSIFDMNIIDIIRTKSVITKWCGTGTTMVSYGVDGQSYPCHTFQSNTTTNPFPSSTSTIRFDDISDFADPNCSTCIYEPICPNCYGMNYVHSGNILSRDKRHCCIVQARAMATSYLRGKQIELGLRDMIPSDIYQTIQAIKIIQNNQTSRM